MSIETLNLEHLNLKNLENLENRIQIIEKKLDRILELLESDCKKMRNHIDFVENIYDNIKSPFNYIMNSVNVMNSIKNIPKETISDVEK
jgi:uncharacterized protein YaaN involved in tellurite resistance